MSINGYHFSAQQLALLFFLCMFVICAAVMVFGPAVHTVLARRPRNRRLNRRLRNLSRRPLPDPWSGAVVRPQPRYVMSRWDKRVKWDATPSRYMAQVGNVRTVRK